MNVSGRSSHTAITAKRITILKRMQVWQTTALRTAFTFRTLHETNPPDHKQLHEYPGAAY
jgi:hypothetical protein